jgi:hypothetical protein
MPTAPRIEERLWAAYEQRFAANHEQSLAYRYEPANEEEKAVVLRYFPPVSFALAKGQRIEVTYLGIDATANASGFISWDDVGGLTLKDGNFGSSLIVAHHDKGVLGARKTKLGLRGIGKQKATLSAAVGQYWQRHLIMRDHMNEAAPI